jgi:hypothetical protein
MPFSVTLTPHQLSILQRKNKMANIYKNIFIFLVFLTVATAVDPKKLEEIITEAECNIKKY